MRKLKFKSQSLQVIILIVGFLPIFFFNPCGMEPNKEGIIRDHLVIDSIIKDSLVKSDSVNLEILFKSRTSAFNVDSFSKFYNNNKISNYSIDSFIHEDSIKRATRYDNSSGPFLETNSIYYYLFESFDYNFKNTDVFDLLLVILPDLIILLSWIGLFLVLGSNVLKFKYLRNISFVCSLSCLLILMLWPMPGFILLFILYLATLIINQRILYRDREIESPAANTV